MAYFLPVAPANYLESIYEHNQVPANRHAFLLAHEVVADASSYARLKQLYWDAGHILLLDNSAIELGSAVDDQMVYEAQSITGANVVVLPDVLENAEATLESCWRVYERWLQFYKNRKPDANSMGVTAELLFIPQGETLRAWVWCLETFLSRCRLYGLEYPKWIGIPRNTTKRIVISRTELIDVVNALGKFKIHLMGFSDYMIDDMISARHHPRVVSIDSNAPFRMEEFMMTSFVPSRGSWWQDNKDMHVNDISLNAVANWRRVNNIVNTGL